MMYIQILYQTNARESVRLRRVESISHTKQMPLEDLLSTKDGFDIFANQLVKEFSIENLFFVYEVMQTKKDAITHKLLKRDEVGIFMEMDYGIVRRQGSVVYNIDDLKKNFRHIRDQYIITSGEYCVNISAMTRLQSINTLESNTNMELSDMIQIFDLAIREILALMTTDSMQRFYQTPEYKVMANNMKGHSPKSVETDSPRADAVSSRSTRANSNDSP